MTAGILDKSAHARLLAGEIPSPGIDLADLAICDIGQLEWLYSARSAADYENQQASLRAYQILPPPRYVAPSPKLRCTTGLACCTKTATTSELLPSGQVSKHEKSHDWSTPSTAQEQVLGAVTMSTRETDEASRSAHAVGRFALND